MLYNNPRATLLPKNNSKANIKLERIKNIVSKTLQEIHKHQYNSKNSINSSPSKRKSDQSSECEDITEILQNLRRGYMVFKHSTNSSKVTNKFVYISADNRALCWKSLDKEDEKQIDLISISHVIKEGSQFYLKTTSVKDISRCLVILSQSRKLQLQLVSELDAEYLRYELLRAVKHSKNMSLNYIYCRN